MTGERSERPGTGLQSGYIWATCARQLKPRPPPEANQSRCTSWAVHSAAVQHGEKNNMDVFCTFLRGIFLKAVKKRSNYIRRPRGATVSRLFFFFTHNSAGKHSSGFRLNEYTPLAGLHHISPHRTTDGHLSIQPHTPLHHRHLPPDINTINQNRICQLEQVERHLRRNQIYHQGFEIEIVI